MKQSRIYKYKINKNTWFSGRMLPRHGNWTWFWGPNKGTYIRGMK